MNARGVAGRLWLRGRFRAGWLRWERGRIVQVGEGEPPRRLRAALLDCRGLRIVPGFVDTLLHGFGGVDASDASPQRIAEMSAAVARAGVTTVLSGIYPLPFERLRALKAAYDGFRRLRTRGARIAGWHQEGPFIAPQMRGALPPEGIAEPSAAAAEALVAACGGCLRMSTIAPELPGAAAAGQLLRRAGVIPSIGHCAAGYGDCARLAEGGDVAVTHLCNRVPPLQAREPGPVGFALGGRARWVGVIPDGVHVAPPLLSLLAETAMLRERLMFQSDNLSHAGLDAAEFTAAGLRLHRDGPAARDDGGRLAGTLDALPALLAARVLDGTLTWAQAIRGGCEVPGSILGDCGRLEPGLRADVVALRADDQVEAAWVGGVRA